MTVSLDEPHASTRKALALESINIARKLIKQGEHREARRWAEQAVSLAPDMEDPWLLMAAVASPEASVFYLKRALEINPASKRARAGMHWVIQRLRSKQAQTREKHEAVILPTQPVRTLTTSELEDTHPIKVFPSALQILPRKRIQPQRHPPPKAIQGKVALLSWIFAFLCIATILGGWYYAPFINSFLGNTAPFSIAQIFTPTASSTFTPTSTCTETAIPTSTTTPTNTETLTPTSTETPTPTPTETHTPTPTSTFTPTETSPPPPPPPTSTPKPKKKKTPISANPGLRPPNVGPNDRWVDVDLSSQITYAFQGDQVVNSFVVSTGLWPHLTITGTYRIYVKYRYADMSGDDYYLPNVPFVMYFYKGYGLHGTYWHNNFGYPMSHGCINLRIEDAGWLFGWSALGTVVNIHQ